MEQTEVNRVQHSHSPVDTVQGAFEQLLLHFLYDCLRILVSNPSCVHRVHIDPVAKELVRTRSRNHIECSFGHVGMRVELLLARPVEHTLHRGNVDDPRGGVALHD